MKKFVIYEIRNKVNGFIYVGMHATNNVNDSYMGSGTKITEAIKNEGVENFEKRILYIFDNKEEMIAKEAEIVNEEFVNRIDTYNMVKGGGMYMYDHVVVKNKAGKILSVSKTDPKYLNGEFKSISCDLITAKDKNGNTFKIKIDDPRFLSGELVGYTKHTVTVFDDDGNTHQVAINDPRYLSGELKHLWQKKIMVRDENNNVLFVDIKDKDKYFGITKGKVTVKDVNQNVKKILTTDPRYLSGELVPIWKNRKHSLETKKKIGTSNSISQKGEKNSQYGTIWITNENLKINKKILPIELDKWEKLGWRKGRKL